LKKTKISIFGGISKFRLWANFGSFGLIWTKFAPMTMAEREHAQSKAKIFKTP
jgi:hypothetical protein